MKLENIVEILGACVYTQVPLSGIEIHAACGADLMSDALAFGGNKGLILTGLNNPQCIRTAEMLDLNSVVLVRGKVPDPSLISLADEKGIVLMKTDYTLYTACGLLYQSGLRGADAEA